MREPVLAFYISGINLLKMVVGTRLPLPGLQDLANVHDTACEGCDRLWRSSRVNF